MLTDLPSLKAHISPGPDGNPALPWPMPRHRAVYPVFLPFHGCKTRCIYCAQDIQTGTGPGSVNSALAACLTDLRARRDMGKEPCELGFYGGTFTALAEDVWQACLTLARQARSERLISGFRCSTRPDSLDPARLEAMRAAGCAAVELGVQSFDEGALAKSRRGYGRETAIDACRLLAAYGLGPGIQLMPGMPGCAPATFLEDVRLCLELGASCLRFYPCLVLKGTPLTRLWAAGEYTPWNMAETLHALALAWLRAELAGRPVIRMGMAPEAGLADNILAGPRHPCLGSRVMGRALFLSAKAMQASSGAHKGSFRLWLPRRAQGYAWGLRGELKEAWRTIVAPEAMRWHEQAQIRLEVVG